MAVALLGPAPSASAKTITWTDPITGVVRTTITAGSSGTGGGDSSEDGGGDSEPDNECSWRVMDPQPQPKDKLWGTHDPASEVMLFNACNGPIQYDFADKVVPPDPAVLARQAFASVQTMLPAPTVSRSPSPEVRDASAGNVPYTLVNMWTYFWTAPQTWQPISQTVSLLGVTATATATPVALVYDPGDGSPPVDCDGPGRPWSESDGDGAPANGACGFQYRNVTAGGPLTVTTSLRWHVTWTGTGNVGGDLGVFPRSVSAQLLVEQIQVVLR